MSPPRAARLAVAVALGIGAAAALWFRAAPIEPYLDLKPVRQAHTSRWDIWGISVTARGGETIDEVRVEQVAGAIHMIGPAVFRGLKAGWSTGFRLQLDDAATAPGAVRVVQVGRVTRTYDLPLDDLR
jgi:hypothetical protein